MNYGTIRKMAKQFEKRGDKLSLECLKFLLARPVYLLDSKEPKVNPATLEFFDNLSREKSVILYGTGFGFSKLYPDLKKRDITVSALMDTYKTGEVNGIPIISTEQYKSDYFGIPIIISSLVYADEITEHLKEYGIEAKYSIRPWYIYCTNTKAIELFDAGGIWEYFALSELYTVPDEVFVDCGVYNGNTSVDFIRWHEMKSGSDGVRAPLKIFGFEPDPHNYQVSKACFDSIGAKLYNAGVGAENGKLMFNASGDFGARISPDGTTEVDIVSLDETLKGERVTLIKMDVEGAELSALKGAAKIITEQKPKLIICVYHKEMDIWEIPEYIWSLNPDYDFYLRHYGYDICGTVLYALPKNPRDIEALK